MPVLRNAVEGTNPPGLEPPRFPNGLAPLTWNAIAGQTYRLQFKPTLAASTWLDVHSDITVAGSTV